MEDPADRSNSDLEAILEMDKEKVLLRPNRKKGEVAVLNPATYPSENWPLPYLYRSIDERGISRIKIRKLLSPTKLGRKSWILIEPTEEYERMGCEDPRVTKIENSFYIAYTAYDGRNVRIALAETQDFKTISKKRIIGPQIKVGEARKLVDDERYIKAWEGYDKEMLVPDKDASLHYIEGKYVLIHRIEPDMHIAFANSTEEFESQDYWKAYFKNLSRRVYIRATERSKKVGLGCPPIDIYGRKIGILHGITLDDSYYASFFEVDADLKVISILKNPLFKADSRKYLFKEPNGRRKKVVFPTVFLKSGDKDELFIHYGYADKKIGIRSTSWSWLRRELDHPANRNVA